MFFNDHRGRLSGCAVTGILLAAMLLGSCSGAKGSEVLAESQARPVITIMAPLHFPQGPDSSLVEQMEEMTGTNLIIDWVPDEIYTDKMNAALTMNSLKKATFVKYTDYIFLKSAIRSGMFWEVGSYLSEYPNLKRLNNSILDQTAVDGKIYGLYTERPSSRQGVIIREDWLQKLKLDPPKTIDQLYNVMKQFTYGDPDGDGKQDTIGLTDRNDLVFGAFKTLSSYFGTPNNWSAQNHQIIPEFETPQYKDTMDFMRKLYNEKLINQEFVVTSKDIQRDLLISGRAGVYIGSMTDVQRLSNEVRRVNPDARFTVVNRIEGPDGYKVWSIPNFNGLFLFSKSAIKTEDELKQVLAFFDGSMEADAANLMKYGLEGRHYALEGKEVLLPVKSEQLRISEVSPLYSLMIADLSNPNLMKVAQEDPLLALAEKLTVDNEKFIVKDPAANLESVTFDEHSEELNKIITDATYHYILGQIDWNGFNQEIERWKRSGGEQIIEEFTQSYFE
ncbi:extracellular solute-binding protein [Paenibacillus sp. JDR-2]|uniref:extracellular solute-binding protein n=1 Tax=Paenibacillus sp. (strain JDR-2) TaxID=324057 RepID=UPI000166A558|nr:extracellular solute-binding protein [Paenibacillus sp. JDR-2]ACT00462.1 extracellular solute-binding protein family 1 [Paenibacillus sp. JDR-2]